MRIAERLLRRTTYKHRSRHMFSRFIRDDQGQEVPSGVYIASLEHEGHQVTARLVHVK